METSTAAPPRPEVHPTGGTGYVWAISLVAALGGLLFGYDTAVISGAIGFLRTHFTLDAFATGWAASSALTGCIVGAACAGPISDRYGRKGALLVSALLFAVSGIGSAVPQTISTFTVYRIMGGIGIGMASVLSPLYIAEVAPARIRGRLVSVNQLAIVTGILLVYFVNYFIALQGDDAWNTAWGWRWMLASESLPAVVFFFCLLAVPESPRWLMQQGRSRQALRVLSRVDPFSTAEDSVARIEEAVEKEHGTKARLFAPGLRRVVWIGIAIAVLQQVTGINVFLYYAPEIFKSLGGGTNAALLQTIIIGAVNLLFTLVAIAVVDRLGRKPLMIIGSAGMGLALLGIGIAAYMQRTEVWVLAFILLYVASFAAAQGPVAWVILSEIFPTRVRGRAMATASLCLWTANYVVSQTFPVLDEHPWLVSTLHHAFSFWLYALMCIVAIVIVWRWVPETKGKTLEEIEQYWLQGRHDGAR